MRCCEGLVLNYCSFGVKRNVVTKFKRVLFNITLMCLFFKVVICSMNMSRNTNWPSVTTIPITRCIRKMGKTGYVSSQPLFDTCLQDTPGIFDWRIGVSVTRKHLYGSKFRRLSVQKYIETTKSRRGQIFSRYGRSGVKTITV